MSDYGRFGPLIRAKILERSPDQGDVHEAIEAFANDVGARVLVSEGAGEVSVLIPESDEYEAPNKLEISHRDSGALIDSVPRAGSIQIEGVGRFSRYVVEPHRLEKRAGKDAPLGIRGGDWSPLGFDGWFFEDLRMWVDLARRDEGLEVRSEVEPDPSDASWRRLGPDQRAALENVLRRVLPDVVHVSVFAEAEALAKEANGAFDTAMASLELTLGTSAPVEVDLAPPAALERATPVLEKVFGAGALDPSVAPPRELLVFVEERLRARGHDADVAAVRLALRGQDVEPEAVNTALERALGRRFATQREVTTTLVDATIDEHADGLSFAEVELLRDLRMELDERAQVELLGPQVADRTLSTASADRALTKLMDHLRGSTGVDDAAIHALATKVQGVVNAPKNRPHVVIVSGDRGPGAEEVLGRVFDAVGEPLKFSGDEMRMFDPVGYLTGSPMGEHGSAVPRLLTNGDKLVTRIDGLEKIGAQLPDEEQRERTARSFFGFVAHLEREGWYRPADGAMGNTPDGRVDLAGGLLVLTTSESPKELAAKMPEDVWAQLAPHVLELKTSDASKLADEVAQQVRRAVMDAGGYPDAQIEIGDRARAMIRDLADAGMRPSVLSQSLIDFLVERVAYAALDGALSPKLRIDLHRGLTSRERKAVVDAWAEGRFPSLAGIGGCPFVLYDEGRFEGRASAFDPKIQVRGERDVRSEIAEYQVQLAAQNQEKRALLDENKRLSEWLSAAETRISDITYVNARLDAERKDLVRLNKAAEKLIAELQKDLKQANARIDALNKDLAKAKDAAEEIRGKLQVAERERDGIERTLRGVEAEFQAAVHNVGASAQGRDPNAVFQQIIASGATGNRYHDAMLEQLFLVATAQALEQSARMANELDKWQPITTLANNYVRAARAQGRPVDGRVLDGFERAARLTGNRWERNLAAAWERDVGLPSGYNGRDPGLLSHSIRQLARYGGIRL